VKAHVMDNLKWSDSAILMNNSNVMCRHRKRKFEDVKVRCWYKTDDFYCKKD
jgi:hypothetical protein